jgi:predicted ATP-dependent endonuclease of OLD family
MRLTKIQIKNFRSFVDSEIVEIDENVTIVIGKSDQGKTTFLRAVNSFNQDYEYTANDFPKHLRPWLEEAEPSEIVMVTFWLVPLHSDISRLSKLIAAPETVREFKVTKFYDGHYEYWRTNKDGTEESLEPLPADTEGPLTALQQECKALGEKLKGHASRFGGFAPHLPQADSHISNFFGSNFDEHDQIPNLIETMFTALKGLPNQDQLIQKDILESHKKMLGALETLKKRLEAGPWRDFTQCLPLGLLHKRNLDIIPDEVNIADFVKDPTATSVGMFNLCKVTGLSIQRIQELAKADISQVRSYEDHYSAAISSNLNEICKQTEYTIGFNINNEKMSISVSDNMYTSRVAPSERSDGFQWFLSFYCALMSYDGTPDVQGILLLDNPALELHADGQRDIKKFLETKRPSFTQVICVTHSTAIVDPFNLEQVRLVELKSGHQGTKITKSYVQPGSFDLLEPVRSAIGAKLVTSLILNEMNVLTEGAADKPIIESGFSAFCSPNGNVLVNGSIAESQGSVLAKFYKKTGLPYVILVDADDRGRKLQKELARDGIPKENIVGLKTLFPDRAGDFELEDIISKQLYHRAVTETYPGVKVEPPTNLGKCTKYYDERVNGFSKRQVGETVKKLIGDGQSDEETSKNLSIVCEHLHEILASQTSDEGRNSLKSKRGERHVEREAQPLSSRTDPPSPEVA